MSKTLILLLLSLLSFSSLPFFSCSFPAIGLDTFLADQARRDPLAANDSFHALPAALRKGLAASAPSPDHAALVSYLLSHQISVPVYVKLVGSFSAAAPSILRSFASAALSSSRFHVVGARPHHLAVGHTLQLDASHSSLSPQISAAIRSHLESATAPLYRSAFVSVPYSIVDQIIQEDFKREDSSAAPGFYIYLLNLGSQSKPYAYSYDPRDASPAFSKCLGTIWTLELTQTVDGKLMLVNFFIVLQTRRGKLSPGEGSLRKGKKTKHGGVDTMTYRVSFSLERDFGIPGAIVVIFVRRDAHSQIERKTDVVGDWGCKNTTDNATNFDSPSVEVRSDRRSIVSKCNSSSNCRSYSISSEIPAVSHDPCLCPGLPDHCSGRSRIYASSPSSPLFHSLANSPAPLAAGLAEPAASVLVDSSAINQITPVKKRGRTTIVFSIVDLTLKINCGHPAHPPSEPRCRDPFSEDNSAIKIDK